MFYNFFFAIHKILTAFYIPLKAAFEDTPEPESVYFDFYLDAVFLIDIIITFNMPLYDQKSRLITDRKVIARKYLKTWFLADLMVCFPVSYFRLNSAHWVRNKDEIQNLFTLNFTSMPRVYRIMLMCKLVRIRRTIEMLTYCLKKTSMRMQH
jgi:hypothetical protein